MHYGKMGMAALAAAACATALAAKLEAQILRGSQASVDRMHAYAVDHSFDFLETTTSVRNAASGGKLVELAKVTSNYELHNVQHPYVMPTVKTFVERLSSQYRAYCGERMVITSAARPLNMKLRNASDLSVHSTGMAVDIRSTKIPTRCRNWLRTTLSDLERAGVIEATEEKKVPHFHVAVFPSSYTSYVANLTRSTAVAAAEEAPSSGGPSESRDAATISYLVKSGDSLWGIAVKHDTSVQTLQSINRLNSNRIHPGQVILVPAAGGSR